MSIWFDQCFDDYLRSFEDDDYDGPDLYEFGCTLSAHSPHTWLSKGNAVDLRCVDIKYARNIKRYMETHGLTDLPQYKFVSKRIQQLEEQDPINLL